MTDFTAILSDILISPLGTIVGAAVGLVVFLLGVAALKSFVRVCAPSEVLVITGSKTKIDGKTYGFRVQQGGWTLVIPYFQQASRLDMSAIPIEVRVESVTSANGIGVNADGTACVCIDEDNRDLLYAAVERMLGKSQAEIQEQIQQTLVGNFRGALNKTTPLEAIGMPGERAPAQANGQIAEEGGERAHFRHELLSDANQDLSAFGMRVVSVSLQKIWDNSNYIANLAARTLSRKRQEVEIEEARLRGDADRTESDAERCQVVATNTANEIILKAQQELEVFRQQCDADIQQAQLEADSAIALAQNAAQQQIQQITVELQRLKNQSDVTLEAEARKAAQEFLAEGQGQAVQIIQEAHNQLLRKKTAIVAHAGTLGQTVLFVQQTLPAFTANFLDNAKGLGADKLITMEAQGFTGLVNRGPEVMVDFFRLLKDAYGISVKDLIAANQSTHTAQVEEIHS
ncbi:hypothetical protein NKDENANG_01775 [Candidatus Entotheonellaceae bacterium PAL068K]